MNKCREKESFDKGLDKLNPNHLKFKHQDLFIEILGGINTESYSMMRVMLVIRGNHKTERDHVDLYNSYQTTNFTKKVAERTGYSLAYVEEAIQVLTDVLEQYKQDLIESEQATRMQHAFLSDEDTKSAKKFLQEPNLLKRTNELIGKAGLIGNELARLVLFLTYLSRIQRKPLHAVVTSKHHYLQSKVGELIPKEQKKVIRQLSENVLFYFDERELCNKLILVEDTGTNRDRLIPLLDFQSNGELTKLVTQKDKFGNLIAVEKTTQGPVSLSISTPSPYRFKNNAVLSFPIEEDQSFIQDEQVMDYQRKLSAGLVDEVSEQSAKELLWNLQRVLEPIRVVNPLAESLILPRELKDKQIGNSHYLRFIEVVTLFKQFQREQKANASTGELYIETEIEDIQEANELLVSILVTKCDTLNQRTREYFEKLKVHLTNKGKQAFTNSEVSISLDIPISTTKRYQATLLSKGLIRKNGNGNRAIGYEYEVCNTKEYQELQKVVETSLKASLKTLHGGSKLNVAQNTNEPPDATPIVGLTEVAQKSSEVCIESNEIKKAV